MSGRPTTSRSTRWTRLLLVLAVVMAVAAPFVSGRVDASSSLDGDRTASATESAAFGDAAPFAPITRTDRSVPVVVMVSVPLIAVLVRRRRRPYVVPPRPHVSVRLAAGGGLRAPPASAAV